ncbi:MAG TPA: TonB-dependent receptor [Rhizomicrobium sp.]|jgi:iron complex outermembrane receptor protein|nr:TonB-dependent receptor [Rhizomicrobium sp.]
MRFRLWALAGAGTMLLAAAAHAQEVETVVVTAKTLPPNYVSEIDKTGTPIADVPRSIEVVPDKLFNAQGDTTLAQVLPDVSGASQGGQYNFGFFDRFIIRGLDATYLDDGLPDGTSDLTGYVHSLTGVQSVEILKGPGSALYGSAEEGGTINLVHFRPGDMFGAWASEQYGSYATTTTDASVTGPTGIGGVDGRLDASYVHSDGFRDLTNQTGDILGSLSWRPAHHDILFRVEYHNLEDVPDAEGIPFSPPAGSGQPLDVPTDFRYYTPFAYADQQIERVFATDAWSVNESLLVNLWASWTGRDVNLARNSGGSVALDDGQYALTRRQLRRQTDNSNDLNFQAEPTWSFDTGGLKHTLITGAAARELNVGTERETADLPNIPNVYDPVVDDGSLASLDFQCDAAHSCDNAKLLAQFYGVYAIDQIDVTDSLKLRLSIRKDWFNTEAAARADIPANGGQEEPCVPPQATECPLVPGFPERRSDAPASWDEGAVYFFTPAFSAFGGYSSAAYPIFNTEEPESVGQTAESSAQGELGLRFQQDWVTASTSIYHVTRDNVFTVLTEPNPSGPGDIDIPQVFSYRVEGWESDVNLQPTDSLSIITNFSYQSPVITSYVQTPTDIGSAVPSVPSILANAWASYVLPVRPWDTSPMLSFGVQYRNHEYADAANTRFIPGDPVCNLVLAIPYGQWQLQAGLSNLFDQRYYIDASGTGGGAEPGVGRTWFVKLAYAAG